MYSALSSDLKPMHPLTAPVASPHQPRHGQLPRDLAWPHSGARTPHLLVLSHCSPQKPLFACRCFPHRNPVQVTSTITVTELQLISSCRPTGEKDLPERTWFPVSTFRFNVNTKPKHQVLLIEKKRKSSLQIYKQKLKTAVFSGHWGTGEHHVDSWCGLYK